jgi:predicted Zn-dependent peptidase
LTDRFLQHTFPNGLTLLGERMSGVRSAAMSLRVPVGVASDPADRVGLAGVLIELMLRGAGHRDSRALTDHLDRLGLQRNSNAALYHLNFSAAAIAERVLDSLDAYADIVRRPLLPEDGFEPARELALQALDGLEDDPRTRVSVLLRQAHWPEPFGRNTMGIREHLEQLTLDDTREHYRRCVGAQGAILALAGDIDFDSLLARVEALFADWTGGAPQPSACEPPAASAHFHYAQTEQTHIGIAWPSVPESHPDYIPARVAAEVLSGGMSGRLFTEVREKRALCYSVGAGYSCLLDRGSLFGYAGTTPERAQETLDQFIHEVRRLAAGVTPDEAERARIGLKSATIMSGESTTARSHGIAGDFFLHRRIRTLEEKKREIDETTVDRVNDYLRRNPPGPFTVVVLGPAPLRTPQ